MATTRPKRRNPRSEGKAPCRSDMPGSLTGTAVYRRLPVRERSRLDRALLLRPEGMQSVDAIAGRFRLKDRYGISITMLREYADRLERLARPAVTSQVLAGVLGCLPESYRRQVVAGSEVMLLSKIMHALNQQPGEDPNSQLNVGELARLASILLALGRRQTSKPASRRVAVRDRTGTSVDGEVTGETLAGPIKLAETVRLLYGLSWPPGVEKHANENPTGESAPPDSI